MRIVKFGETHDLTVICGEGANGYNFLVSRAVLIDASPVWRAMLEGDFQEASQNEVTLSEVNPVYVEQLLTILFPTKHGHIPATAFKYSVPFLALLDKFQFFGVKERYWMTKYTMDARQRGKIVKVDHMPPFGTRVSATVGSALRFGHIINPETLEVQWDDGKLRAVPAEGLAQNLTYL